MGSAVGVFKTAAKRTGLTVEQYRARTEAGEKWCTSCKTWHLVSAFPVDRSRGDGRKAKCLAADHGKPRTKPRDPEKERARSIVAREVGNGRLAKPNDSPCMDCGHFGPERRHEYDHHNGYTVEHQLSVETVCTLCHADRERRRRHGG